MKRLARVSPERLSQAVAAMLTAAIIWALQHGSYDTKVREEQRDSGVRLSLLEEPPQPEEPKVQPAPPRPAKPADPPKERRVAPHVVPIVESPAPVVSDPAADMLSASVAPSAPAPPAAAHATIEDEYAAALRRNVDSRTTVPTSAEYRLLKPSGTAQVRFAVDRVGTPSDVVVARSSGSGILDRQAVTIVASGHYPPFPEAAYPGETRHIFLVTIEFRS